jgi:hypothetical protein
MLDIGFERPADVTALPDSEREQRVRMTPDLCSLDGSRQFIRGIVEIPIVGSAESFCWGVWAEVSRPVFAHYLRNFREDGRSLSPPAGTLANSPPGYPNGLDHPLSIHFRTAKERPLFLLVESDHPLSLEQRAGISGERLHQILEVCGLRAAPEATPRSRKCGKPHYFPNWPFADPYNLAAFTTQAVFERGSPILHATHELSDGAWTFIGPEGVRDDLLIMCLVHIVELDPTLTEVADLPLGWGAERSSIDGPWRRYPLEDDD